MANVKVYCMQWNYRPTPVIKLSLHRRTMKHVGWHAQLANPDRFAMKMMATSKTVWGRDMMKHPTRSELSLFLQWTMTDGKVNSQSQVETRAGAVVHTDMHKWASLRWAQHSTSVLSSMKPLVTSKPFTWRAIVNHLSYWGVMCNGLAKSRDTCLKSCYPWCKRVSMRIKGLRSKWDGDLSHHKAHSAR